MIIIMDVLVGTAPSYTGLLVSSNPRGLVTHLVLLACASREVGCRVGNDAHPRSRRTRLSSCASASHSGLSLGSHPRSPTHQTQRRWQSARPLLPPVLQSVLGFTRRAMAPNQRRRLPLLPFHQSVLTPKAGRVWYLSRPMVLLLVSASMLAPMVSLGDMSGLSRLSIVAVGSAGFFAVTTLSLAARGWMLGRMDPSVEWWPTIATLGGTWLQARGPSERPSCAADLCWPGASWLLFRRTRPAAPCRR